MNVAKATSTTSSTLKAGPQISPRSATLTDIYYGTTQKPLPDPAGTALQGRWLGAQAGQPTANLVPLRRFMDPADNRRPT